MGARFGGGRGVARWRAALVLGVVLLGGCGPSVTAQWRMNETSGRVMVDSAGDNDGQLTDVALGQPGHTGTAYRFNGTSSIVRVPDAGDLDPGTGDFSFGGWVNFTELPPPATWDVVRKGISGTAGGYYKLELFEGNNTARARCFFRDGSGFDISVVKGTNLNDGDWHRLTCRRVGNTFSLVIDGATSSNEKSLGAIANGDGLTVGAKPTGGDVFDGLIDDVEITKGR